jgi:hypothetical protein
MMTNARCKATGVGRMFVLCFAFLTACSTLNNNPANSLVPTRFQTRTGPYVVFTNHPVPTDAAPIRHLQSLERQLAVNLAVRSDPAADPIEVYVLDDRQAFDHFLRFYYPELPARRAFFLAQGAKRVVYTYASERLEEDLRHEATHALLHTSVSDLPLWLDEGLAEYFEVPEERRGLNAEHLGRLPYDLADGWSPDLASLERLTDVRKMTPRDYRESWAWVHYLLNGPKPGKAALLAYLADLHNNPAPPPLSQRLSASAPDAGRQLLAHLETIEGSPVLAPDPAREAVVRLQDAPADKVAAKKPHRRGLLGRIAQALGLGAAD